MTAPPTVPTVATTKENSYAKAREQNGERSHTDEGASRQLPEDDKQPTAERSVLALGGARPRGGTETPMIRGRAGRRTARLVPLANRDRVSHSPRRHLGEIPWIT